MEGAQRTSERTEQFRWQRIVRQVLCDATDPQACFRELFHHFAQPHAWRTFPEVSGVLAELKSRGLVVGIASNFDERLLSIAQHMTELQSCEFVLVSSRIGYRKPHRRFFEAVLERVRVPPEQVLYVGDDPQADQEGPRDLGMCSLLVDRGGSGQPGRIRSLEQLLDYLALGGSTLP
jgi:putative hydrolase of the HAD superfamily